MTILMRALNLSSSFITWKSNTPDYEGTYAPESIQSGSAIVVADTGGTKNKPIQKLGLEYDPVGLWLFENNLNDSSGNGFNLTGAPRYTTLARDRQVGAIFEETGWKRPSRDSALVITGALTIEACITIMPSRAALLPMAICSIGTIGETSAENVAYYLTIEAARNITLFWEYGAGTNVSIMSPPDLCPIGIPFHVVCTRSGGELAVVNIYMNGMNVHSGSNTAADGCTDSTCLLRVGANNTDAALLPNGTILTSLKIIAAELTPAQVVAEYNRVLGGRVISWPTLL